MLNELDQKTQAARELHAMLKNRDYPVLTVGIATEKFIVYMTKKRYKNRKELPVTHDGWDVEVVYSGIPKAF